MAKLWPTHFGHSGQPAMGFTLLTDSWITPGLGNKLTACFEPEPNRPELHARARLCGFARMPFVFHFCPFVEILTHPVSLFVCRFLSHAEVSIERRAGDFEHLTNIADRNRFVRTLFLGEYAPRFVRHHWGTAAFATSRACCRQACSCPFLDQSSFELGQCR